jgi:hypothetical protein
MVRKKIAKLYIWRRGGRRWRGTAAPSYRRGARRWGPISFQKFVFLLLELGGDKLYMKL